MNRLDTRKMIFIGLMTAILVILSQISIPMPSGVPITLQTFAVALIGFMLGWKSATIAVSVYILLGAVGVPVFSNARGGIGALLSVTGGFIWGFIPFTMFCGIEYKRHNAIGSIVFGMLGLVICHVFGVLQYSAISSNNIAISFAKVSLPYLIKDGLSVVGAYYASIAIKRIAGFGTVRS